MRGAGERSEGATSGAPSSRDDLRVPNWASDHLRINDHLGANCVSPIPLYTSPTELRPPKIRATASLPAKPPIAGWPSGFTGAPRLQIVTIRTRRRAQLAIFPISPDGRTESGPSHLLGSRCAGFTPSRSASQANRQNAHVSPRGPIERLQALVRRICGPVNITPKTLVGACYPISAFSAPL